MTDKEIADKLQQKDVDVFDHIMERYNKLLWVVVGNILEKSGSKEDIEDCISDVYVKLIENPNIYDYKKGSLKSFLVRVGKNLAIDKYRKLRRNNPKEINEYFNVNSEVDPQEFILMRENREEILEILAGLREVDKEVIIRRYFLNEKNGTISKKMNLPSKKIENILYQGKIKLKAIITNKEDY